MAGHDADNPGDTDLSSYSDEDLDAADGLLAEFGQVLRETDGEDSPLDDTIPGYTLKRELYRGGQGVILEAEQQTTNRTVAIKLLLDGALAGRKERMRFDREVELAAQLKHQNIVTLYEGGRTLGGRRYVAMELVVGVRLDVFLRSLCRDGVGPDEIRRIVGIFVEMTGAIAYAHQRGVIHRDLKPANVLVTDDGRPIVLDFGIAKSSDPASAPGATQTGDFVGTLMYAAPEQIAGESERVDTRADLYSLGVMLFEALTGQRPHGGQPMSLADTVRMVTAEDAPRASSLNKAVPRDLDAILRQTLERDPDRRTPSAVEVREELTRWLEGRPVRAREHERWYLARRYVTRRKEPMAIGAVAVVLLGIAGASALRAASKERERQAEELIAEASRSGFDAAFEFFVQSLDVDLTEDGTPVQPLDKLDDISARIGTTMRATPDLMAYARTTLGRAYVGIRTERGFHSAEREFREALNIRSELYEWPHVEIAEAHHNLGRALWYQAKFDSAELEYREARKIWQALYGYEHLKTARTTHHLAAVLGDMGEQLNEAGETELAHQAWEESVANFAESLRTRTSLLGPEDPEVANTLNSMALTENRRGRTAEAKDLYRQSLAILAGLGFENDLRVARVSQSLAACLIELGEYEEAELLLLTSIEIKAAHPDALGTANSRLSLARLMMESGKDPEDALRHAEFASAEIESLLGSGHPNAAEAKELLRMIRLAVGFQGQP